jgi:alkanesulfonate monooxygenase SsuD/methylene tetrahydromethanopterin reductase-like flavin-dependent oxidoreductase (luciferase family)
MRFATMSTLADPDHRLTHDKLLDTLREQTVLADELGFETMWLGEHHFGPYGTGNIPNPILVGADLAAHTRRMRLGQLANIAVWWHPIRLAEDIAVLDHLTKGRIDVGFGRGIWPYEGPQFHPNADPRKVEENQILFRETVEIVIKAMTQEFFSHEGPNYRFPAPGTTFSHPRFPTNPTWQDGDRVVKLNVTPKPYQKPHPPLWMTVSTDQSVRTAAELGLTACYWQPPPLRLRERFRLYADIRSRREGRPFRLGENQAVMRHVCVASTSQEARQIAERGVMFSFTYNDPFRGLQVFMNPGEQVRPDMKIDWDFLASRNLLVGSPAEVADKIHELQEVCGLEYLVINHGHGWLTHDQAVRNLELFAAKVMPQFSPPS